MTDNTLSQLKFVLCIQFFVIEFKFNTYINYDDKLHLLQSVLQKYTPKPLKDHPIFYQKLSISNSSMPEEVEKHIIQLT